MCAKASTNAKCIVAAGTTTASYSGVLLKLMVNPAPFDSANSFNKDTTERAKGVRPSPLGLFSATATYSCFSAFETTVKAICKDYAYSGSAAWKDKFYNEWDEVTHGGVKYEELSLACNPGFETSKAIGCKG